jgi:hypothetical protein
MLWITGCLCKTGPDLRRLFHGELYRKSGDNLSYKFCLSPWQRHSLPPPRYQQVCTKSQSSATPFNVVSRVKSPVRTFVLGTDIKCRLYSNNSTAVFTVWTAATTFVTRFNINACNPNAGLQQQFWETSWVWKQYLARKAQNAERISLNRTAFCYTDMNTYSNMSVHQNAASLVRGQATWTHFETGSFTWFTNYISPDRWGGGRRC